GTTEPSTIECSLLWHGHWITPSAMLSTLQPRCVQVALNPLKSPAVGWVTTRFWSARIRPPPTSTSAVLATGVPPEPSPSWPPPPASPPPAAGGGGAGGGAASRPYTWQPASTPATPVAPAASTTRRGARIGSLRIVVSSEHVAKTSTSARTARPLRQARR